MTNPYYNNLFDIINEYVSEGGKIQDGSKLEILNNTDPVISVFEPSAASASSYINIAGNYKYSCVVPLKAGDEYPPNYVGVLQENNILKKESLIYELLTFANAGANEHKINCNRLVASHYNKLFRIHGTDSFGVRDSDTRMINFTNGLPYSFYEPGLRVIHKDITKKINRLIDFAIRTGQDEKTETYSKELVKRFHEIFFDWTDDNQKEAVPKYYSLRTGILPTAISFAKWKAAGDNKSSLDSHATDYLSEIDYLKKDSLFMPGGLSYQFNTSNNTDPLYWYPFNVRKPYSYSFAYGKDQEKDKPAQTTDDQKYELTLGFKPFNVNDSDILNTVVYSVPTSTSQINEILTTNSSPHPMILSYESSLSTVPAPKTVTILPKVDQFLESENKEDCWKRGIRSDQIIAITDGKTNNIWANPFVNGAFIMHPLLNRSGKKEKYLDISIGKTPEQVNDDTFETAGDVSEEAHYYNGTFPFSLETRAVDRLNYFSSNANEKSCAVENLEFAKVSKRLFNVADNSKLVVDNTTTVSDTAFGIISKKETNSWKTKTIGITESKLYGSDVKYNVSDIYKNSLFSLDTIAKNVPSIEMGIRGLHYMDPVTPKKGNWTEGMTCPYRKGDIRFLGSSLGNCRQVPQLRMGTDKDGLEWNSKKHDVGKGWKDHEVFNAKVDMDEQTALVGRYNQRELHSICKAMMDGGNAAEFYYTIHILADDGKVSTNMTIDSSNGKPNFQADASDGNLNNRYGTGLQYFFGGMCSEGIYRDFYDKGLTVQQLLNRLEDISISDEKTDKPTVTLSRVAGGLKRANITFDWDYSVLLEAWQIALWIMRGTPDEEDAKVSPNLTCKGDHGKEIKLELWNVRDAPLALAAFFDHIYGVSHNDIGLLFGPSLKQINNFVGPYGSANNAKGGSDDTSLTDLKGATWDAIQTHRNAVKNEETDESKKVKTLREKLNWDHGHFHYGNRYINANDHALVSMHVFADKNIRIYNNEKAPYMYANGVRLLKAKRMVFG